MFGSYWTWGFDWSFYRDRQTRQEAFERAVKQARHQQSKKLVAGALARPAIIRRGNRTPGRRSASFM